MASLLKPIQNVMQKKKMQKRVSDKLHFMHLSHTECADDMIGLVSIKCHCGWLYLEFVDRIWRHLENKILVILYRLSKSALEEKEKLQDAIAVSRFIA